MSFGLNTKPARNICTYKSNRDLHCCSVPIVDTVRKTRGRTSQNAQVAKLWYRTGKSVVNQAEEQAALFLVEFCTTYLVSRLFESRLCFVRSKLSPRGRWHCRCSVCPSCDTKFPTCIVSGRPLMDYQFWMCQLCKHRAYESEITARQNCPLCHNPV